MTGGRPPVLRYGPAARPWPAVALGCHARPDRCLTLGGRPMPVCARCSGVVAGFAAGAVGVLVVGLPALGTALAGLAAAIPLAVDGFRQAATGRESTNPRRLATGLLAGTGQAVALGGAIGLLAAVV